jgi:hypothetical protein
MVCLFTELAAYNGTIKVKEYFYLIITLNKEGKRNKLSKFDLLKKIFYELYIKKMAKSEHNVYSKRYKITRK